LNQTFSPYSPLVLDIKYPLFTHATRDSPVLLDINDLSLRISANHSIFFIAHGFFEFGNAPWIIELMNELLDHDNGASVVVVDWRGGSSPPYYQAVANIRVIGAMTAHLIYAMSLDLGVDNLDNFHLIGHSLGAHLCGYAGYFLQRDFDAIVGRITGLDPAKPYFEVGFDFFLNLI
jgi:pancreatic triacylglycerol lipase